MRLMMYVREDQMSLRFVTSACTGTRARPGRKEVDEVEAIVVTGVKVDGDALGAVEPGGERERLSETAILAGPADEDTLAFDPLREVRAIAKTCGIDGECHMELLKLLAAIMPEPPPIAQVARSLTQ
jgi:hypothetical protein